MIAMGICNVMGSFVSSYPTTGSFSRTAVNAASGVRTQMGGIYTGALVLLALGVLMEYCAYIPKATLAAVIITAVIFSVEFHVIRPMWESKSENNSPLDFFLSSNVTHFFFQNLISSSCSYRSCVASSGPWSTASWPEPSCRSCSSCTRRPGPR